MGVSRRGTQGGTWLNEDGGCIEFEYIVEELLGQQHFCADYLHGGKGFRESVQRAYQALVRQSPDSAIIPILS